MKKVSSVFLFFLLSCLLSKGQAGYTTIAVLAAKSDYGAGMEADWKSITEMVSEAFTAAGRFDLFDDDRLRQSMADSNLLNVAVNEYNAHSFITIGVSLGIEYFVLTNVKNVSTKMVTDLTGKAAYTAHIIFSLKLINVNTGEIGDVREFDSYGAIGGYVSMSYDTEQNAVLKTISGLKDKVTDFIDDKFPLSFPVMSISGQKNGSAEKLEILGGKNLGLTKGTKLKVLCISIVIYDGKKIQKRRQVGMIKITEVQGDDISEANVTDGGKDILEAFQADGKSLVCELQ
jgi:hypothetical protein